MLYPEIKKLMGEFDSRYSLVVATSKRARQLAAAGSCDKAVSMAIKEISEGYVHPILTDEAIEAEQAATEE
ncbi:MAG: DNA-directed RNA polymerase subunit omega [Oscillospiraceae bacterium]|nr:DNA-directed RNA polymerase subunit omega [Oscillospiraceae bacterium]